MVKLLARVKCALDSIDSYLNFVAVIISTQEAFFVGLVLDSDPEFSGGGLGSLL